MLKKNKLINRVELILVIQVQVLYKYEEWNDVVYSVPVGVNESASARESIFTSSFFVQVPKNFNRGADRACDTLM